MKDTNERHGSCVTHTCVGRKKIEEHCRLTFKAQNLFMSGGKRQELIITLAAAVASANDCYMLCGHSEGTLEEDFRMSPSSKRNNGSTQQKSQGGERRSGRMNMKRQKTLPGEI